MIALLAAVTSLTFAPIRQANTASPTPEQLAQRVAVWEAALRDDFVGEEGLVAVDVSTPMLLQAPVRIFAKGTAELKTAVPKVGTRRREDLMAAFLHREVVENETGYTFFRTIESAANSTNHFRDLTTLLTLAPPQLIGKLLNQGAPLDTLPEGVQKIALRVCSLAGVQKAVCAGKFVYVRIVVDCEFRYTNDQGKATELGHGMERVFGMSDAADQDAARKEQPPAQPPQIKHFEKSTGPLDLSEGKLIALGELSRLAEKQFHRPFGFDGRLKDSYVYLQGKFNERSLSVSLRPIMRAVEWHSMPTGQETWQELVDVLARVLPGQLTIKSTPKHFTLSQIFGGMQGTVEELSKVCTDLKVSAQEYNFPASMMMKVMPIINLSLSADGGEKREDNPNGTGVGNYTGLTFVAP